MQSKASWPPADSSLQQLQQLLTSRRLNLPWRSNKRHVGEFEPLSAGYAENCLKVAQRIAQDGQKLETDLYRNILHTRMIHSAKNPASFSYWSHVFQSHLGHWVGQRPRRSVPNLIYTTQVLGGSSSSPWTGEAQSKETCVDLKKRHVTCVKNQTK